MTRHLLVRFHIDSEALESLLDMHADPHTRTRAEAFLRLWDDWGEAYYSLNDPRMESLAERLYRTGFHVRLRAAPDADQYPTAPIIGWERRHPLARIRPSHVFRRWDEVQAALRHAGDSLTHCTIVDPYGASSSKKLARVLRRLKDVGTTHVTLICRDGKQLEPVDVESRLLKAVVKAELGATGAMSIASYRTQGASRAYRATVAGPLRQVRLVLYPRWFHDRFLFFTSNRGDRKICVTLGYGMEMLNRNSSAPCCLSRIDEVEVSEVLESIVAPPALRFIPPPTVRSHASLASPSRRARGAGRKR